MVADWDVVAGIRGLGWPVTRKGGSVVDGRRVAAARIIPTATQTVTDVDLYVDKVVGSGSYRCDVWKESDLPWAALTSTFRPNEDQNNAGGWAQSTGASLFGVIDEAVLDKTDYVYLIPPVAAAGFTVCVGSAAGLGAGAQIVTSVELHAVVGITLPTTPGAEGATFEGTINTNYVHPTTQFVTPAMGDIELTWIWTVNPATGVAWTEAEIVALDDGASATSGVGVTSFSSNGPGAGSDRTKVYDLWVVVNYYNDARLATADLTISTAGWKTWDTANFTKTNAQNIVAVVSRVSGSGSLVVPALDSGALAPSSPGAYRPTLDSAGNVTALNTLLTQAHPIIFPVAGAASIDSQPYVDLVRSPVDAGHTIQQEFTADATDSRQWVKVVLGSTRHQLPGASLTVKIRQRSDNTQVGGTGTITAERIADAPYPLQAIDVVLASAAALTNGTQYYVELASTATAGQGWDVAVLDAKAPLVTGYSAGFGAGTDRATISAVEYNDLDAVVVVGTVPTAPTGMAAVGG